MHDPVVLSTSAVVRLSLLSTFRLLSVLKLFPHEALTPQPLTPSILLPSSTSSASYTRSYTMPMLWRLFRLYGACQFRSRSSLYPNVLPS